MPTRRNKADMAVLESDVMVLPVQINGKKRAEISVPKDADNAMIEAAVLAGTASGEISRWQADQKDHHCAGPHR